ncbi:CotH kinase family protein (plasmid) [Deinococcus taeanensis]|uniref:CotH kinase family protein n=1 Tax=Deinococcus taeanensis TaxID=2737050 RepID=UPI001CDCEA90|nr:CotH kinase family protein [Deinococcus taeanensis]UBV44851.1 CotH kinase family protein [Deinococcus taeanensis]
MKTNYALALILFSALQGPVTGQSTSSTAPVAVPLTFATPLPLLNIATQGRAINDEPKTAATLSVTNQGGTTRNRPSDPPNSYQGAIGIEIRGSSSQAFPKKQYSLETRGADGKASPVSLLGLPAGRNWILSAAYTDPTLLRDSVAYNLSRRLGRYASRTVPVELILNGEYQGVYILEEKLEPQAQRISLSAQGALLQITPPDRVKPGDASFKLPESGTVLVIESPKGKALSSAMKAALEAVVVNFAQSLYHPDPGRPGGQYLNAVDLDALVDFVLLNEYFKNADAFFASTYLTVDLPASGASGAARPGRVTFGPVWDMDRGMGNSGRADFDQPSGWVFRTALFTEVLYDDPTFVRRFVQRWKALRSAGTIESLISDLDRDATRLTLPAQRNFTRWPIAGQTVIPGAAAASRYPDDVAALRTWLTARARWMDSNINALMKPGW